MGDVAVELHIRHWRTYRKRGLQALAKEVGISKTRLNDCERGRGSFRLDELLRLAVALGVPPWQLVTFHGWPCPLCQPPAISHPHGDAA